MTLLTAKEQQIAAFSAAAARGNRAELKQALTAGLDAGLTVNEIKEILIQLYAYCGFPRSLNALAVFRELLTERGPRDEAGPAPRPLPAGRSIESGTENQTRLCGSPVQNELYTFAPAIDEFLKAHLFGDIFGRDNITWPTRELATIAMLATMPDARPQLQAHLAIGRRNGLSEEKMAAILTQAAMTTPPDVFPTGKLADDFFTGTVHRAMLIVNAASDLAVYNVTFAPGARTKWHKHVIGQMLLCTVGTGYYQERGQTARRLTPGEVVEIPADVEHWHGASSERTFVHIGMTPQMSKNGSVWLEPVTAEDYEQAQKRCTPEIL
ncbi:MAG: carboxymuconolactone decarboxylase family protein [Victivallales bacterium]|nr:carboxymuconolactone decarboxylase family protein [Victivallales bacterium]